MRNAENRTWAALGNVKSLDGPMREAKRKHSPVNRSLSGGCHHNIRKGL